MSAPINGAPGTVQSVIKGRRGETDQIKVKLNSGDVVTVPRGEVAAAEAETILKSRLDQLADWLGKDFDGVIAFDEAHNMGNAITVKGGNKDAAKKALAELALQDRLPNARIVYVSATGATEVGNLAYADRLGLWGRGTGIQLLDSRDHSHAYRTQLGCNSRGLRSRHNRKRCLLPSGLPTHR